ncbi:MAG TPA: TolC family outer membrane protein [Geminicoccaceae bacterium]|nr:TolC family outer membrane protein [Geminicoccaceae bacterium]
MQNTNRPSPKALIIPRLLASVALLAGLGGAEAGTVDDSIRAALATNPEVGIVRADRRAVDQELRQARAGYLPQVDIRGAIGPEYTDSVNTRRRTTRPPDGDGDTTLLRSEAQLTLSQMLFDGFETRSEVERQAARVSSAAYRVEEAAEFVALNAVEAHLDVLRNQEIQRLNEANIAAHQRILGQVGELERQGAGDIADVRQTEARVAVAETSLATARGSVGDAIANYIEVVGERPENLILDPPPIAALPAGSEAAAAAASVRSPTVKIAAADVDVSSAELRGARANFAPRFDLEVGGTAGNNLDGQRGNSVDASALLVLRYNLFRGGADIAREREAFHRMNEARYGVERARRRAEEEARVSYNALETARARTVALRTRAEAQRRTRDAYGSQFEIGQRGLLDLLDAENELFLSRVQLITAEYVERFAVYRVLAVTGDLLETLELAVPMEQVDIYRTPSDVQTPEAIGERSRQVQDPRASPRPLRGLDAGEPPPDAPDLSVVPPRPGDRTFPQELRQEPRPVTSGDAGPALAPAATTYASAPADDGVTVASSRGIGGFFSRLFGAGSPAPVAAGPGASGGVMVEGPVADGSMTTAAGSAGKDRLGAPLNLLAGIARP